MRLNSTSTLRVPKSRFYSAFFNPLRKTHQRKLENITQLPREILYTFHSKTKHSRVSFIQCQLCNRPCAFFWKFRLTLLSVLEARLEQADLLKKVSCTIHTTPRGSNFPRLSMPSRIWFKTATSTAMTPVSHSRPWITPTSPSCQ